MGTRQDKREALTKLRGADLNGLRRVVLSEAAMRRGNRGTCFENGQCASQRNRIGRAAAADIPIVLTEDPGAMPNWVAAAGIMEAALTGKFSEKVAEHRSPR
jgi:hypothetical protein